MSAIPAGRFLPGEFLAHSLLDEPPPVGRSPGVAVGGLPDGTDKGLGRIISEDKPVAGPCSRVVGADGFLQAAGGPDDRAGSVPESGEQVESAGFDERGG